MRTASLVPDPAVATLEEIVAEDTAITFVVRACQAQGDCPACGPTAVRQRSWYTRRLGDLPWQGAPVQIRLRTRR